MAKGFYVLLEGLGEGRGGRKARQEVYRECDVVAAQAAAGGSETPRPVLALLLLLLLLLLLPVVVMVEIGMSSECTARDKRSRSKATFVRLGPRMRLQKSARMWTLSKLFFHSQPLTHNTHTS